MLTQNAFEKAMQLSEEAASLGFDFPDYNGPLEKIVEETRELRAELEVAKPSSARILNELGDLLFSIVNLARKLDIDPEIAIENCNEKFTRRFSYVKTRLADHPNASLEKMERWWEIAKDFDSE